MRKLEGGDIFSFLRVVKATNAHEEVAKMAAAANAEKKSDMTQAGLEFILRLLGNCADKESEAAVWEFISGPAEKAPEELKKMPLNDIIGLIEEIVEDNKESGNLTRFFALAGKLMK